jgi:hypothetical protein
MMDDEDEDSMDIQDEDIDQYLENENKGLAQHQTNSGQYRM